MAFSLIASVDAGSPDSNAVTTGSIDTTGADYLIVVVSGYKGTNPIGNVSDSKGNTWASLTAQASGGSADVVTQIFYCTPTSVGSGHTFTVGATATFCSIYVTAWSTGGTVEVDQQNGSTGTGGSTILSGAVTPSTDNQLVVMGVVYQGSVSGSSINGGFTWLLDEGTVGGQHHGGSLSYLIQTSAALAQPTLTMSGSSDAGSKIATFKITAAATKSPPPFHRSQRFFTRRR